jgi:hypothetical protein
VQRAVAKDKTQTSAVPIRQLLWQCKTDSNIAEVEAIKRIEI